MVCYKDVPQARQFVSIGRVLSYERYFVDTIQQFVADNVQDTLIKLYFNLMIGLVQVLVLLGNQFLCIFCMSGCKLLWKCT